MVQQGNTSSIQAIYFVTTRSYAPARLYLAGDACSVFPRSPGTGEHRVVADTTSLADALADPSDVDDALNRWSKTQLQVASRLMPIAEYRERSEVLDMPDLTTMPTTATNDWMSSAFPRYVLTLPDV
jgi:2-polyprenyl-6-methoxyphenol hydroxylase-like FAD-dependent oxidoreductase